ncbi:copper ABC transporter ATP-binding protein [Haladaptatus sp. W1]|uniref:ABC transporter ATP-binding protein n=1 Tax=Haladaptatus sp. W1 TaxID=1897478 RepID=UPI000849B635|nr:ABC transporter ATP-binding protein [Haladaptatus sp. W1]ODR83116.1 copper ABC transporter ATP-binding protein [Haladaptatus sp. W1]
MTAIELTDVSKRFGNVVALRNLNLQIKEGEVFGFLGPNGAGKSTTIDMILDYVRPTSGSVTVFGHDAQRDTRRVHERIGVLPDAYHAYDHLSARQHLEFVIETRGVDDDPMRILQRVGIPEAADRRVEGFSKGMAQRLILGMALVGDPDLLILDEPTTGLDPNGALAMREIIREERDRGTTVFFSSHILEQVEAVCDRVGILDAGELVTVDSIDGLRRTVGSGASLTVEVDRLSSGTLDRVRAVEGVGHVSADGTTLVVACTDRAKKRALDAIESAGDTVLDFDTEEASLEELFTTYTTEVPA